MEVLIWGTLFFVFTLMVFCHDNEALRALSEHCDAAEAFYRWRIRNQGVYIGLSPEGSHLVIRCLEAYDEFMRTHSYIPEEGHREFLLNLLNDFPPQTPKSIPVKRERPVRPLFLFIYVCCTIRN